MIGFRVNGQQLVLLPDTEVDVLFTNAALSDDLQDDFSLPFTVPVHGNEVLLQSVHDLTLHERTTVFTGAIMEYQGVQRKKGDLHVEQASEERISLSFTITGFIGTIRGVKLAGLDMGPIIQTSGILAYAKAVNLLSWPLAPCCFPMYLAKDFYGDENPDWQPKDVKEWEMGGTYAANDIVTDTFGSPIAVEYTYQRLFGSGPTTPPAINPTLWRRTSFGIVNHWDWSAEAFLANTTTQNFYALSPVFYLKYILQQAFASVGYTVGGSFFEDPRYDRLFLYNNGALDSGTQSASFLVHQTGSVTATPGEPTPRIPGQDEVTAPNQDPDNRWDNINMRWQCPSDGSFTFRVYVPFTPNAPPDILKVSMMREGSPDVVISSINHSALLNEDHNISVFTVTMGIGNINNWFYFKSERFGPQVPFVLQNCWIEGWKNESSVINQFSDVITPVKHVPDMLFADLLLDLKLIYGLRITADLDAGQVTMAYAQDQLAATPQEMTAQVRSPITIEISNRAAGITWEWDNQGSSENAPDLSKLLKQGEYPSYGAVPGANGPGLYSVVLADRRLLVSRFDATGGYLWFETGQYLAPYSIGDDSAGGTSPKLAPMASATVGVELQEFLIPSVPDKCTSDFFASAKGKASLLLGFFHGMQPNMEGKLYPYASSYRYLMDGTPLDAPELDWTSDRGPIALHQQKLGEARVFADPITCDLEVDMDFIDSRKYERPLLIHGQRCLVVTLPVKLGDGRGVLIAKGVKLIKLRN